MNSLIISAVGSDRSGIVSEISGIITNHGGNVEESRMSKMGSDFAIIMLVSVPLDWEESLELSIQSIKNLTIITKHTAIQEPGDFQKYQIDLNGADNEGIVQVLSKYLAEKSINIIEMNTYISYAPVSGTPLFNLKSVISIPDNLNISDIQTDVQQISQILGIEIVVHKSESILEIV